MNSSRDEVRVLVDWRIAVAAAGVMIVLFAVLALPIAQPGPPLPRAGSAVRNQGIMWGLWLLLLPVVFGVSRRVHAIGVFTVRGIARHIVAAAAMALVHGVLWGVLRWHFNPDTIHSLDATVRIMVAFLYGGNLLRYAVIAAAYHGLAFRREVEDRRVAQAKLEARLAEAQLQALESRLHPHFLFNALNTVAALIRTNPAQAQSVVENLGELLRAALNAEPGKEVALRTELELAGQYVAIQRARFSDRLRIHLNAPEDVLNALVPQMVLQPFIENAIRHGIAPREAPGTIDVAAERTNGRLRLTVRDDGVGFAGASCGREHGKGIGINTTRARLVQLYGTDFVLDVAPNEPTGVTVTLELPYRTGA